MKELIDSIKIDLDNNINQEWINVLRENFIEKKSIKNIE